MDEGWLYIAAILILVGIFTHTGAAFLVGAVIVLASAASTLWYRRCLDGVEYRRSFSPRRAYYGEEIEVRIEITNRKLLPLAWLESHDEFPDLPVRGGQTLPSTRPRRQILFNLVSVRWYERVRRRVTVRAAARGLHSFGPVRLRSGDIFGLRTREAIVDHAQQLIVYPKVVPLEALGLPAAHPFGDIRSPRPIFEDPSRIVGVRAASPDDPLRRIHWKASARTGSLVSKVYESTTTPSIALFVNVDTLGEYAEYRGYVLDLLEMTLMVAASAATWAIGERFACGLYANGLSPGTRSWVKQPPAQGSPQLAAILELLARVYSSPAVHFADLLQIESAGLPYGATVVAITGVMDPEIASSLRVLRDRGFGTALVLVGSRAAAWQGQVPRPTYHVGDERWKRVESLSLDPLGRS